MRTLTSSLETAQATFPRQPAYKILAFDPTIDSMSAIINGEYTQIPLDLTPYATDVQWSSGAPGVSTTATGGTNTSELKFTLIDPLGVFNPDSGSLANFLQDRAIIRLLEGDARVDEADWVYTFTGLIHGQVGWVKQRDNLTLQSTVTVFPREAAHSMTKQLITSSQYTVGTELGVMLQDICSTFIGLTPYEYRIPQVLGLQLLHQTNQISQMAPWDAITAILQTVNRIPYFDGEGRLYDINTNLQRPPDRILPDYVRIYDYEFPEQNQDTVNKVVVTFIDSNLTEVDSPLQKLGDAQCTTGFFSMHEKLRCWWSQDHTQRAKNTYMKVIKSVNSGLLPVGSERYSEEDEFHGQIDVDIAVWVPMLAITLEITYAALALSPDMTTPTEVECPGIGTFLVQPSPFGGPVEGLITVNPLAVGQWTISVGRIVQTACMIGIAIIMMSMSSCQYEVWGIPFTYAYLQEQSTAMQDNLQYYDEVEEDITCNFLGSYAQADVVALTELIWQKSLSYPRRLQCDEDLALEVGDIVALPDGRELVITGMSKTLKRGEIPIVQIDGGKVMSY